MIRIIRLSAVIIVMSLCLPALTTAQLLIDGFSDTTVLASPPGILGATVLGGLSTYTDLVQLADGATVLGGTRSHITAFAAGTGAGGAYTLNHQAGVTASGHWKDDVSDSIAGSVARAGHRFLGYGVTVLNGQANATIAPTGQVGVLGNSGPTTILDASTYMGVRIKFTTVSASSVGAPFRISLVDAFSHVIEDEIFLTTGGAQNMDFAFGSFTVPAFASVFGPSAPGVFDMTQVRGLALDYKPTAVSNFSIRIDSIRTFGASSVPEGSSILMLGAGIMGAGWFGLRKRRS